MPWVAPIAISVGMFFLWLDLEHPFNAWRFYLTFKLTSPMSWGAWILLGVYPVSILLAWVTTPEKFKAPLAGRLERDSSPLGCGGMGGGQHGPPGQAEHPHGGFPGDLHRGSSGYHGLPAPLELGPSGPALPGVGPFHGSGLHASLRPCMTRSGKPLAGPIWLSSPSSWLCWVFG